MDLQATGNFIVSPVRYKQAGDNKPNFRGKITLPGTERVFAASVWTGEFVDKSTGEVRIFHSGSTGDIAVSDSAMDQIKAMAANGANSQTVEENGLSLRPGQFVLFENGFKAAEPEKNRPDFWGRWNPGNGEKLVALGVWARKSKVDSLVYLAGETSYPQPGKDMSTLSSAPEATLDDLIESGVVTRGPKTKTDKSHSRA